MSLWKFVCHITKEGHWKKKVMSLDLTIFFKWETPATKYHIYSLTNFMVNILADKILYSDFSF